MAYVDKASKSAAGQLRAGRAEFGTLTAREGALNFGGRRDFTPSFSVWYGRLGTTASELYTAQQANIKIDRRIKVRADKRIIQGGGARIDDTIYTVIRLFEDAGGRFYDLSLSEVK